MGWDPCSRPGRCNNRHTRHISPARATTRVPTHPATPPPPLRERTTFPAYKPNTLRRRNNNYVTKDKTQRLTPLHWPFFSIGPHYIHSLQHRPSYRHSVISSISWRVCIRKLAHVWLEKRVEAIFESCFSQVNWPVILFHLFNAVRTDETTSFYHRKWRVPLGNRVWRGMIFCQHKMAQS